MNWLRVLKKCISIDTNNINYLNEYIFNHKCFDGNIIFVMYNCFRKTIAYIINDIVEYSYKKNKGGNLHLCYVGTVNQYNALETIVEKIDDAVFLCKNKNVDIYFLRSPAYLISWFFLPYLFIKYFSVKRKESKHNLACYINDRFNFYGQFLWFIICLNKMEPKSVIVANDHSTSYRLMKEACKFLKIPIIYIQHASVTEKFPKLDFDISFLEGEDALNKYKLKGIEGDICLVGMPKFDQYYQHINTNNSIYTIGISLNIRDPEEAIESLLKEISKADFTFEVIIRPHPRDKRHKFYEKMAKCYNCVISDARYKNSFDFLKTIDLNIACESSIHLEATLMNVYPVYYKFNHEVKDNYGYIKNNLVTDIVDSPSELINLINSLKNNKPNIRNRSEYYVSTVNSKYDGKSSDMVKDKISNYFKS